jgi:hypothetical protein
MRITREARLKREAEEAAAAAGREEADSTRG